MRGILLLVTAFLMGCQGMTTLPEKPEGLIFVSHRGITSERLPENTIMAFENVIRRKIAVIELDVRTTSDEHMIIMHDAMVNRTTDGSGFVREMTLADIKSLDAGEGEKIPTLKETLDLFQGTDTDLLLDLKDENLDNLALILEIESRNMEDDVILGARYTHQVHEFNILNPNILILGFTPDANATDEFVKSGTDIIRFKMKWLDSRASQILEARKYGLPIWITSYRPTTLELNLYSAYEVSAVITDNI